MSKPKIWKYHKSHSFTTKDGYKASAITQLYQVGVYMIVNNDPAQQMNIPPSKMVSLEKKLNKAKEKGDIVELEFGIPITVTEDENGLYIEKND